MQPKPNAKNWTDAKLAITAIAITATLGFWNLFASLNPQKAVQAAAEEAPAEPEVAAAAPAPQPAAVMPEVRILLGGTAPQPQTIQVPAKRSSSARTGSS